MANSVDHGQLRAGLLTSSRAKVIMRGSPRSWDTLRDELWRDSGEEFAASTGGAREYGHEHEAEGAAKFWERHPEFEILPAPFFTFTRLSNSPLNGMLGSSPDRLLMRANERRAKRGLEVKSPTSEETFEKHNIDSHIDQCQHGMLVTGFSEWFLVVHHGELYKEFHLSADRDWQSRYLQRAEKFIEFCYQGKSVKRRRLRISDL